MCLICSKYLLSKSQNKIDWVEAQKEWVRDLSGKIENSCICGKEIQHCFPIKNKFTGEKAILGSVCITNYNIFTHNPALVEIATYFKCKFCQEKIKRINMAKHILTKKHLKNKEEFQLRLHFRQCQDCAEYKINITSPVKIKYCDSCYSYKHKWVPCPDCGIKKDCQMQYDIFSRCYDCNLDKKFNITKAKLEFIQSI